MKSPLLARLKSPPRLLGWRDLLLTLLPAILWYVAVTLRPVVIHPHCAPSPSSCPPSSLPAVDRATLGREDMKADFYSFVTQDVSGVLAAAVPVLWNVSLASFGRITPAAALASSAVDLSIFMQTSFINGLLTESTRLVVQRPRPFVYSDPARAADFSNYVSFYSGHTSFSAAACMALLLTLFARNAPTLMLILTAVIGQLLVISTGLLRVLAGRHFPTDVLMGAVMGSLVALAVAWLHRHPDPDSSRASAP